MRRVAGHWTWMAMIGVLGLALQASAGPDFSGSSDLVEPNGFPGVCAAPCYTAGVETEVWLPTNPDNPLPSPGNNTYVYKISHTGGTGPVVLALLAFDLSVDLSQVVAAGYLATSPGVEPSDTQIFLGAVTWKFETTAIQDGESSKLLYVHSPLMPGAVSNNAASVAGQAGLDAPGSCLGPLDPPVGNECSLDVEKEGCVVQPPDVVGDSCQGKVTAFTFEYTGQGCSASSHLQNPKKVRCQGDANGESPVDILVTGKKRKRWSHGWGWWGKKRHKKTIFAMEEGVAVGGSVAVEAANAGKHKLGSSTRVVITSAGGGHQVIEFDKFHTSCSEPFGPGMVFGSVLITSVTSTGAGTVTLPDPEEQECITSIDVVPPPHCQGKLEALQLRYTGGDCSQSMNSQSAYKTGCTDVAAPSANPVRIIISNGQSPPPYSVLLTDESPVEGGGIVTVTPAAGCVSSSHLGSVVGYWIKDAVTDELIQDGYFHTSCSQPLNLGDQFGALQVFGEDTTQGGSVALGAEVEYTYVVTNPNASLAEGVSVDDDLLGNIASGVTLAAGESATFTTSAVIEQETTNVATVTGSVAGQACEPGTGEFTITVEEPPEEPQICTKKIAAMLLQYTGPDIPGATVVFTAKSFYNEPVTYAGVDLTNGTVLSMPSENGFSIDGTAHGESDLGSKTWVSINGVTESLLTSCSVPFASQQSAPLDDPKGAPSPNWHVVDFTEKVKKHHHGHHHH